MAEIKTKRGQIILVSDEDYETLSKHKWCLTNGYPSRRGPNYGKILYMHRIILDAPAELHVDHVNGNKLDNRRENLRLCTGSQNMVNVAHRTLSSKFRGVSRDVSREKWKAQIQHQGINRFIGRYDTQEEAAAAYNEAAKEAHGEFVRLNEVS